jgi:hypothetical protein
MRTDTRVLSHDSLGGRGTGSPGARGAARHIAAQLEALGLQPIGPREPGAPNAFLLPVPLLRANLSDATLTASGAAALRHGEMFVAGRIGRTGLRAAEGPVHSLGIDSAAVPASSWVMLESSLGEAAARWLPVWRSAGAVGVIVRLGTDAALAAYHAQLGDVRWLLASGDPDPIWQPDLPIVMISPSYADLIIESGARVRFDPRPVTDTVTDFNVAGVLRGAGEHADEFVVLTAHYDHLGVVHGISGDSIYNGFSDNAAGVSMLLAIAAAAVSDPPRRSLLFLFPAAEESGLLGSLDFVRQHPDVVARTHALLNLDAGAPPAPPTRWRLAAGTRSWAGDVAARVVESNGWAHRADPGSPNSDHWPFVALDVPAVFLIPDGGYESTSDAEAAALRERWDRYHHPDDEWHADFPWVGVQRYATLARDIAYALARAEPPR